MEKKIDELYQKSLKCTPLEQDLKYKLDVKDWIKLQPVFPKWQILANIEVTANEARKYAKSVGGKDKFLHCLAGCYVAQKLDYKSAVLVGWMKELSDASDCSKKTSFEKSDYDATIVGAHLGKKKNKKCRIICKK